MLRVTLAALALAGCGGVATQPATSEAPRPAAAAAPADQPSATASDQPRLAEQMTRIAGELSELQNAVAKLIAGSRQQDDQLTYLRRRVEELAADTGGRADSTGVGDHDPGRRSLPRRRRQAPGQGARRGAPQLL